MKWAPATACGKCFDLCGLWLEMNTLTLHEYIWKKSWNVGFCHIKDRLLNFEHSLHSWLNLQGVFFPVLKTSSSCSFPRTYNKATVTLKKRKLSLCWKSLTVVSLGFKFNEYSIIIYSLLWTKSLSAFTDSLMQSRVLLTTDSTETVTIFMMTAYLHIYVCLFAVRASRPYVSAMEFTYMTYCGLLSQWDLT